MSAPTETVYEEVVRKHRAECPIGRYDRYLAPRPGEDETTDWTRVTTAAGALDGGWGMIPWRVRTAALGFALDNKLYAELCTLVPAEGEEANRKRLDTLCEKAHARAGGDDGRDNGKLLHTFSELTHLGEKVNIPSPYREDIAALQAHLAVLGIEVLPEYVERYVQLPDLSEPVMGRSDHAAVKFGSELMTADLKTGTLSDYSWMKIAAQLAFYSRATHMYNPGDRSHEPMPEVSQDTGLVFHLPYGQARCDVWAVDLNIGWEIAQLCLEVRDISKRSKRAAERFDPDRPVAQPEVRRQRLIGRISDLTSEGRAVLAALWPESVPTFKQSSSHTVEQLDLIALAISTAEARVRAPFGAPDPVDSKEQKTA